LLPVGFVASFYLAVIFSGSSIAILFAMAGAFMLLSIFNIVHEFKKYRTLAYPTFTIYEQLMKDSDNIRVSKRHAIYGSGLEGSIVYNRTFPGQFENEEFESFSLVEREVLEYPFKQAILKHDKQGHGESGLNATERAARNRIKQIIKS
jgi:hypothetical protein